MRTPTLIALGAVTIVVAVTTSTTAAAAVLCQKKNGLIVVRDPSCKKKETPFDVGPFVAGSQAVTQVTGQVADLDGQVSSLQAAVTTLSAKNFLEAGKPGTIAASATVSPNGNLAESFTQSGSVSAGRSSLGNYSVSFGFTLRLGQTILITPQQTYPVTRFCQVTDIFSIIPFGPVSVSCSDEAGTNKDVQFSIVVLN